MNVISKLPIFYNNKSIFTGDFVAETESVLLMFHNPEALGEHD